MAGKYVPDQPPGRTKADMTHAVAKATVGVVPFLGPIAAEALEQLFRPVLEARRDEWLGSIGTELHNLQEKIEDLTLEDLANNPSFATTFFAASQVAMRTHQQEKRDALRNAVVNTAIGNSPDDDVRAVFLNLVERFTPSHLRVLRLLDDPAGMTAAAGIDFSNKISGSVAELIETALPEMKGRRDLYDLIATDLNTAGLIGTSSFHGMITGNAMLQPRTSQLGKQFLRLISEPS